MMIESCDATRVLLVEDNRGDAVLMMDMLQEASDDAIDVTHVSRLAQAGDTLRDAVFDVVLLDLRLPDSSGVRTLQAVERIASGVPVIVVTGQQSERTERACRAAGASGYVCKHGMEGASLLRTLQEALVASTGEHPVAASPRTAVLRLFVTGTGAQAQRAIDNFHALCRDVFGDRVIAEVVDVLQSPGLAAREQVLATPVLIKRRAGEHLQVIGDLGNTQRVMAALGVSDDERTRWS